ncbi:N-acetylmuramoyl-L-alanine amidase [Roseibium sp.]|uniref:N-acetylmuramoyl-L-alanine amidase n=1 Tax=Roseibium sp. TaxID=1936156 RepID=UPI003D13222A
MDPDEHPYYREIHQLEVSAHLLIDREGRITQFVPFDKRAWHAGRSCFQPEGWLEKSSFRPWWPKSCLWNIRRCSKVLAGSSCDLRTFSGPGQLDLFV